MDKISIDIKIINNLKLILKNFSQSNGNKPQFNKLYHFNIQRENFPLPQLIFFILAKILRFKYYHHLEKILWLIPFYFNEHYCEISLRKFGLRLDVFTSNKNDDIENIKEKIISKLNKASYLIEKKVLNSFANNQLEDGDFTIQNQYIEFTSMYNYFRENADNFFKLSLKKQDKSDNFSETINTINQKLKSQKKAYYNAFSMIDTFYSRLEHLFVLSLAFLNFNPSRINVKEFIFKNWSDKYKDIFDISSDSKAKMFYDELKEIKEKYRNTKSHGGFDKEASSIYFHLPEVGAISCSLSKYNKSLTFNFIPFDINSFKNICSVFDEFDTWLDKSKLKYAVLYIKTGLDVPFDKDSILKHNIAIKNEKSFNDLIEERAYFEDLYTNMDF